jgi:hypothetical protein
MPRTCLLSAPNPVHFEGKTNCSSATRAIRVLDALAGVSGSSATITRRPAPSGSAPPDARTEPAASLRPAPPGQTYKLP